MSEHWELLVNDIFASKTLSDTQIRAFCCYSILKDRVFTEVLPAVLTVLDKAGVPIDRNVWSAVWGKLTSAAIYLMVHTILELAEKGRVEGEVFNELVCDLFIRDFNEKAETLIEYERENPVQDQGSQPIWAMSSQICKVVGHRNAPLAIEICQFWQAIAGIEAATSRRVMTVPISELQHEVLRLNYVQVPNA